MTNLISFNTPLLVALLGSASAVSADVTPAQVWEKYKSTFENVGYDITATEQKAGKDLNITDMTLVVEMSEPAGKVQVSGVDLSLRDNGDGTVTLSMPSVMTMDIDVDMADDLDEDIKAEVNYNTSGLDIVVSGSADAMTYTFSAAAMEMALGALEVGGEVAEIGEISISMNNVSGTSVLEGTDLISGSRSFAADKLQYLVDVVDPDGSDERFFLKGGLSGLVASGKGSVPTDFDPENLTAALANGFAASGSIEYAAGASEASMQGGDEDFTAQSSSSGGAISFAMDNSEIQYGLMVKDVSTEATTADFPFPIQIGMSEVGFDLAIPVAESEEPQDFTFGVTLADFTFPDMIWGLFDPVGQLPRDPATLIVDLSGKVKMLANLMDTEAMAMVGDEPAEIHALNLNELKLSAAGAELTGDGAVTFDNTDTETFDGIPRPEGAVNLALIGGNALLDKLIAMGFVPEQEAMGVRMMVGMFSVPNGPDDLKSTIEFTPEGQIMANGQRLK